MEIDFDQILKNIHGKTINDLVDGQEVPVTLKQVAVNALFAALPNEREISGEEKLKRYQLALRINKGGKIILTAEELSLIKKMIGKSFSTLVSGQAWMLLEGESPEA
jgi:hypothetical protein